MITEMKITTHFGEVAAKRWGQGGHKVLGMHGWLDNAASLDYIAPLLNNVELVALDFLGHGLSAHLPKQTPYTMDVQIQVIEEVIEQLRWSKFSILGHSLGAIVGTCIAAQRPQQVDSLISLDALGPISTDLMASDHPVSETVDKIRARSAAAPRIYESIEQMSQGRSRANHVELAAIRSLVERNAKPVTGGWSWRFDSELLTQTKLKYADEQGVIELLQQLQCPVAFIRAQQGILPHSTWFERRLAAVKKLYSYEVPGHHHFHLEAPHQVAECINAFWQDVLGS